MIALSELAELDRKVARAHDTIVRLLPTLDTEDGRAAAREIDPFANLRAVSGQTAFRALEERELTPGGIDAAHRDALLRWVLELLQTRVAWDLTIDEAEALHEEDPSLHAGGASGNTVLKTYAEAFRALICAPHERSATTAFGRLEELAAPVAAVRKELRARRFEVARRLGLVHPWSLATSDLGKLGDLARAILGQTDALMTELLRNLRRRTGSCRAAHHLYDGFARDAREGWPARLGARWLEDVFKEITARAPRSVLLPGALGGASFLRGSYAWGEALRIAGTARSLPFALSRDPYATEPPVIGGVLASVVASPPFAKRKLGLTGRASEAHVRSLGRSLFFELRRSAASILLGIETSPDAIEELGARVLGSPLSRDLGACWSYGGLAGISRRADLTAGVPARLTGAVRAFDLGKNLVDRFDEDWFDNPRAGAHLAAIGAGPVWHGDVPEPERARAIARAFEEILG